MQNEIQNKKKSERNTQMMFMRDEGFTMKEIAKRYEVSVQRVHQICSPTYKPSQNKLYVWEYIKEKKIKEDGECKICFTTENLDVYPLDGIHANTRDSNLITACHKCIGNIYRFSARLNEEEAKRELDKTKKK